MVADLLRWHCDRSLDTFNFRLIVNSKTDYNKVYIKNKLNHTLASLNQRQSLLISSGETRAYYIWPPIRQDETPLAKSTKLFTTPINIALVVQDHYHCKKYIKDPLSLISINMSKKVKISDILKIYVEKIGKITHKRK